MSLTPYHLHWSDALIKRVELRLRQLHACLNEFYQKHNYSFNSHAAASTTRTADGEHPQQGTDNTFQREGPINTVGGFLLRTCVHSSPFYETQLEHGVGADLALTLPEEVCSLKDIQDGLYLERRHAFLLKVENFLKKYNEQRLQKANAEATGRRKDDDDDDDDDEDAEVERHSRVVWDVQRVPFGGGGGWANTEKQIVRVVFLRPKRGGAMRRETFHVDVHFQPTALTGRIASAAAVRKHPHYSYLVQEDALMTVHLRKLHELYSQSHSLLRATVFLKCWAHHVGLTSRTSGHPEGLSSFHISALILRLVEEGVVTPAMSEENVVRAVWVYLSRNITERNINNEGESSNKINNKEAPVPAAEEKGEVAVLRLTGETMNLLFRTSTDFFRHIIKKAADEALQLPHSADAIMQTPFQPLQLRLDVCLVVEGLTGYLTEVDRTARVKTSGAAFSVSTQKARALCEIVREALGARANYTTVWRCSDDAVQVAVQLSTEAEGRNRLTRGPALEDAEGVERFNAFWGKDVASTRQFPDGGIYRCVLWRFDEDAGAHTSIALPATTVMRRVLEFALRKHVDAAARVSVLLGGLEGVLAERVGAEWRDAAPFMQKSLMEACRDVETMIAEVPRTALPCKITAFDIIAASERHTEAFPVRPHLALTQTADDLTQPSFAGLSTAPTIEPIHGVLTIDDKNKIPDTPEAIATIKGAICAQLSRVLQEHYGSDSSKEKAKKRVKKENRILHGHPQQQQEEEKNEDKKFSVRTSCTSTSVDIIYKGYLFRLYIAHYREVSLLKTLQREAEAAMIERKLFWSVQHAKFMRTIAFGHHSYATATRLAKRWLSAMLMLEFILPEAVELLVANAYLGQNPPKTPVTGFMRFVQLLATHDWSTPLVLPYSVDSKVQADAAALVRTMGEQQGMYIATPYAPLESPFTAHTPRPMIMHRVVQLAKGVVKTLLTHLDGHAISANVEAAVFTSDPSAFDLHMPFHPHLLLQPDRLLVPPSAAADTVDAAAAPGTVVSNNKHGGGPSSTLGGASSSSPEAAIMPQMMSRVWQLDELEEEKSKVYLAELVEREPAAHVVRSVRAATRDRCMVFFDCLAPRAIYVITITPSPMREVCQKLHDDILRVSRGALMPATWTSAEGSRGTRVGKRAAAPLSLRPAKAGKRLPAAAAAEGVPTKMSVQSGEGAKRRKRVRGDGNGVDGDAPQCAGSPQAKRPQQRASVEGNEKKKQAANPVSKRKKVK